MEGNEAERTNDIVDAILEVVPTGTRLFMIMEVNDTFSFDVKKSADEANPKVREWEERKWQFQQSLAEAKPGEKWLLMQKIFDLNSYELGN